ncbi:hypothetical protein NDU88_005578 [Pleurodeles waltl]|uniref:Uncharacterized protein n=1 Tax=Pleurodeles waltl TaxID=8319 RepID=A0AAV7TAW3_PLEWA|nr:hypothetical protein NDU88_005578 [Pleurodeles waltl]
MPRCSPISKVQSSEEPECRKEATPPQRPSRTGRRDASCLRPRHKALLKGDGGSGPTEDAEDAHPKKRSEWLPGAIEARNERPRG